MRAKTKKKIVVLGMMSRQPVAGMIWLTMQYVVGFERLGYEVYYVEPQGGWEGHDSSIEARWIDSVMRRFDLPNRWVYDAVHGDRKCYGLSKSALKDLYHDAAWIFNLHGSTKPTDDLTASGRLVYISTDPVELEVSLWEKDPRA